MSLSLAARSPFDSLSNGNNYVGVLLVQAFGECIIHEERNEEAQIW